MCKHDITCECSIKGKLTDMPYPKATKFRAKECLVFVPSDIAYPFKVHPIGGKTYFLTFVDDYIVRSRWCTKYAIRMKH